MDFALSTEIDAIRQRTRAFVGEQIQPLEDDRGNLDEHEKVRIVVLARVQAQLRESGL